MPGARALVALVLVAASASPAHTQPSPGAKYQAVLGVGVVNGEGSTAPLAGITLETGHAEIGAGIRLGVDLTLAREPRLAMLKVAGRPLAPGYLDGWTTAAALRFAHAWSRSEVSMVGALGTARLDSANDAAVNGIGRWTAFYDARGELRWYRHDMSEVYRSAEMLMPVVHAYGGVRHDQRFHRYGDLSSFNDPTARWVFGAVLMPLQVAPVSFGGGFEFETAMRPSDRLPSGLKFVIRADLDLGKALSPRSLR